MKLCNGCGETKPPSEFNKHGSGKTAKCRSCINAKQNSEPAKQWQRDWYQRNKVRHRAQCVLAYRARTEDPKRAIFDRTRTRARSVGIVFDLTIEDVPDVPNVCPILGIPLVRNRGKHGPKPDSPSIDKIVPSLGYVRGNVAIISHRANTLKNNATEEELEAVLSYMRSHRKLRFA